MTDRSQPLETGLGLHIADSVAAEIREVHSDLKMDLDRKSAAEQVRERFPLAFMHGDSCNPCRRKLPGLV